MAPDATPAFGDLLRRFRSAAGLTQEELAARSGVSARAIGDLERDRERVPHTDTLDLLATALDLSAAQRADLVATRRRKKERGPSGTLPGHDAATRTFPLATTQLLGREAEIALAGARLCRPDVRLLTLTGTGGVGKTRLALKLAQDMPGEFRHGVQVVALAALTDPLLVPTTVARALGVSVAGRTPATARLASFLRDKQLLLVLDNCEHLLDACAKLVAELLGAAPGLKVLATSRAPLGLTIECEHPVPPLALPDASKNSVTLDLRASPAIALFLVRTEAILPGFQPSDDELTTISKICRRLDGIPLAIELAAARVRLLTPAALLERLDKPLTLLTGGPIDLPPRQQTLRQTIDWSFTLLSPAEQALFTRFSVFAGGATLEAVEAVNGSLGVDTEETLSALDGLVRANLVRREDDAADQPRFNMLETVREYAGERLDERGDLETMCRSHVMYYLNIAERAVRVSSNNPLDVQAESRLEAERSNLRAALVWTARHDRALGLRLAVAHCSFWTMSGSFSEGRRWLVDALNAAPDGPVEARAVAYSYLGRMATHQSDHQAAERALSESLVLFRQVADAKQTAWALHGLGRMLLVQGDRQRGIKLLEESLALSEGQDPSWGGTRGLVLEVLGADLLNRGGREDADRGEKLAQDAVAVSRASCSLSAEGLSLVVLAWAAYYAGDNRRAFAQLNEAFAIWRSARRHILGVHIRLTLGWFSLMDGQLETAVSYFHQGLLESAEVENWARVVDALRELAGVASRRGCHDQTARLFGAAARLRETSGWQGFPSDPAYERVLQAARAHCEPQTWDAAWSVGQKLTVEEVIAEALAIEA